MKATMKNGGFYTVLALIIATLVIGCPASGPSEVYKPADGMGSVRVSFNKQIARATILPDAGINVFKLFALQFTANGGGTSETYYINNGTAGNGPVNAGTRQDILLKPGTYDLLVVAYLDGAVGGGPDIIAASALPPTAPVTFTAPTPAQAAAAASATGIPVNPGAATDLVPITLQAFSGTPPTGVTAANGTFTWTIDNQLTPGIWGTLAAGSTMTIAPIATPNTPTATKDLTVAANLTGITATQALAPGFYYVDFHVETTIPAATPGTIDFRYVLHIYQNFISHYGFEIIDDLVIIVRDGWVLSEWEFINPADEEVPPELTWENDVPTAAVPVDEGDTVYANVSGDTVTLRITNTYTTYQWFHGADSLGTTPALVVNPTLFTTYFNSIEGLYMITVVGTTDGVPYSTYFFLDIK